LTVNPAANDRRRDTRKRKLGPDAACVLCGERRPDALILERHHVALVENEPNVAVVLCKNCHAVAQESLRCAGVVEWAPVADTWIERELAILRGEADFLQLLAESRLRAADQLEKFFVRLEAECADWRTWDEVQP
jgi:hypothetical protein